MPLEEIPNVLRNFGAAIKKLDVEFAHYPAIDRFKIIWLCERFCSEQLTKLGLSSFEMNDSFVERIRSLLRPLR